MYSPQSRRVNIYFSFATETPANENHHAFGILSTSSYCPKGLGFIPFRPLSEKEYKIILCDLCVSNERSEWTVKQILKISTLNIIRNYL